MKDKMNEEYDRGFWHGIMCGASLIFSLGAIVITILAN